MPKILKRLVSQLEAKGKSKQAAYAIAVSSLQKSGNLQKGTTKPTAQGVQRGNMTAAERAKNRAARTTGRKESDYTYNQLNNTARLKRK